MSDSQETPRPRRCASLGIPVTARRRRRGSPGGRRRRASCACRRRDRLGRRQAGRPAERRCARRYRAQAGRHRGPDRSYAGPATRSSGPRRQVARRECRTRLGVSTRGQGDYPFTVRHLVEGRGWPQRRPDVRPGHRRQADAGVADGRQVHQPQPVRHGRARLGAVPAGERNTVAPLSRAPIIFCVMPPIGPTLPVVVDGPGAGDELAAGQRPGVSLSTMPSANISPALGPPTSLQTDPYGERVGRLVAGRDADDRRPSSGASPSSRGRAALPVALDRRTSPGRPACGGDGLRAAPLRRRPACRRPRRSRRRPAACPPTATRRQTRRRRRCVSTGMPSCAAPRSSRAPASAASRSLLCCSACLALVALGIDLLLGDDRDRAVEPAAQRGHEVQPLLRAARHGHGRRGRGGPCRDRSCGRRCGSARCRRPRRACSSSGRG